MKSRSIFIFFMLLSAATFFNSCGDMVKKVAMKALEETSAFEKEDTVKWGPIVEQGLDLPAFTTIDAKGAVRVVFIQDSVSSVRVRGNEKCLEAYKFEVRKDELKVVPKNFDGSVKKDSPAVTLFVSAPCLSEIEFAGAGNLDIPEAVSQPGSLDVEMEGAGEINIADLAVKSLNIEVNGAGRCILSKVTATEDIEIEVNGAGDVNAHVFCEELTVELNGAGHAVLSGECKKLNCEENGASKIDFSNLKR
ncbi:MAG: DUF2807 domain-containing protein [Bacteroidaceae bacterium]|nr:DUF2807 domain-containing protein [Bacteroidaceae bacterium]